MSKRLMLWLTAAATLTCAGPQVAEFEPLALRECPHNWPFGKEKGLVDAERQTNIPEFNDCQRFIVGNQENARYDSLFAIFASTELDTLMWLFDAAEDSAGGAVAFAAATIYAEGVYAPLGIRTRFSCLFLYRDATTRSDWGALMVPMGRAEPNCRGARDTAEIKGTRLQVRRDRIPDFEDDNDYPPVARWDFDEGPGWQHFIGIKCGAAWCEIGREGFGRSPSYDGSNFTSVTRRVRAIKGWYDEQLLSVEVAGQLVPSRVRGTIFPDSELGDHRDPAVFRNTWKRVAFVALSNTSNPYQINYGYDAVSTDAARMNQIYLCNGLQQNCLPGGVTLSGCGDNTWWGRIDPAGGGASVYKCVHRYGEEDWAYQIPGTVRWRWRAIDEGWWSRCLQGCCEDE